MKKGHKLRQKIKKHIFSGKYFGFYVLFFLWARRSYSKAEIQRRHRQLSYFVAAFTGTERRVTRQNIATIIAGSPKPNILC